MGETFSWAFDAASGVYKSHALSGKLLELAALDFKVVPFTKKITGYGKRQGQTVTLPYYKTISEPTSAELEEQTRIPIDKLEMGTYAITIKEWGRGVEFTSLAEDLSVLSPNEGAQKRLKDQMALCMDTAAAAAFTGTNAKVTFIPTSLTGGTWDTDGTPSTMATYNVTRDHLGCIRDYLANTLHTPFYGSKDHYIGLFATKALRGLKNDRVLLAFNMYLQKGDIVYNNEVGMVENIRLIEINHENALSDGVGTGSVLGEGVVFGEDAVGRLEIEYPHLRADLNFQSDFGRRKAVVWYGTVAFDVMFQSATDRECRIVKVTSA
jgi:N4-gp56 family major capsid protein